MGYLMPKPPLMTKEQSDKWDKRESRYYNVMAIMMVVAAVLFCILLGFVIWAKTFKGSAF